MKRNAYINRIETISCRYLYLRIESYKRVYFPFEMVLKKFKTNFIKTTGKRSNDLTKLLKVKLLLSIDSIDIEKEDTSYYQRKIKYKKIKTNKNK